MPRTPLHNRTLPYGFTEEWNDAIWNVGHIFRWSEFYQMWVKLNTCTVKPTDTLHDAFTRREPDLLFTDDYTILFVAE